MKQARAYTLEFWESYFDEGGEAREHMRQMGCRSPRSAARKTLASDGLLGDMQEQSDGKVHYVTSCGQIRDELRAWFPEFASYFGWHLNDMRAECEHQEHRGETWETHPMNVCGDCGYKLGSGWQKRTLPTEVVEWVERLAS